MQPHAFPITFPPIFVSKYKHLDRKQIYDGTVFFPDGLNGKTLYEYIDDEIEKGFHIYDRHLNFLVVKGGYILPYEQSTDNILATYSPDYKVFKAIGGKSSEAPLIELLADAITGKWQKELMQIILKSDVRSNDHIAKSLQQSAILHGKQIVMKRLGLDNPIKRAFIKTRVGLHPNEKLELEHILGFDHESHKSAVLRETLEETGHTIEENTMIPFMRLPEIKSTKRGNQYIKDRVYYIGKLGRKVQEPKLSLSEVDQHLELTTTTLHEMINKQMQGIVSKYDSELNDRPSRTQQKKKLSTGVANLLALLTFSYLTKKKLLQ